MSYASGVCLVPKHFVEFGLLSNGLIKTAATQRFGVKIVNHEINYMYEDDPIMIETFLLFYKPY